MFEHLRHHTDRATGHTDDVAQHEAFLELLVLAMYADRKVSQQELDALEAFEAEHGDWEDGAFAIGQYLGVAVSKVRTAIASGGATDELLAEIGRRITTPALRQEACDACAALIRADGDTGAETDLLGRVRAVLGS
jgi:hypothetical protein